jgi:hypothetical protein
LKSSAFWDITSYSPLKINRSFGRTFRFHFQGRRIKQETSVEQVANSSGAGWLWRAQLELLAACFSFLYLAYYLALEMETTASSETVDFQRTTWRYIWEDRILHNYCCENLRSYRYFSFSVLAPRVGYSSWRTRFNIRSVLVLQMSIVPRCSSAVIIWYNNNVTIYEWL